MQHIHNKLAALTIAEEDLKYYEYLLELPFELFKPIFEKILEGLIDISDFYPTNFSKEFDNLTRTLQIEKGNIVDVKFLNPLEVAKLKLTNSKILTLNKGNYALVNELKERVLDLLGGVNVTEDEKQLIFIDGIFAAHVISLDYDENIVPVQYTQNKSGIEIIQLQKQLQLEATVFNEGK